MINKRREPVPEIQKTGSGAYRSLFGGNGGMILDAQFRFLDGDDDFLDAQSPFWDGDNDFVDAQFRFWDGDDDFLDAQFRFWDGESALWMPRHRVFYMSVEPESVNP